MNENEWMNDTLLWSRQKSGKLLQLVVISTDRMAWNTYFQLAAFWLRGSVLCDHKFSCVLNLGGQSHVQVTIKVNSINLHKAFKASLQSLFKRKKEKESGIIPDFWVLHHPWNLTFGSAGVWSGCFYLCRDWQRCWVVSALERFLNRRVGSLSKAHEAEWQRLSALWLAKNSPHRGINKEAGFDMSHMFLLLLTAPSWVSASPSARQVWRSGSGAHQCMCAKGAVQSHGQLQNVCRIYK